MIVAVKRGLEERYGRGRRLQGWLQPSGRWQFLFIFVPSRSLRGKRGLHFYLPLLFSRGSCLLSVRSFLFSLLPGSKIFFCRPICAKIVCTYSIGVSILREFVFVFTLARTNRLVKWTIEYLFYGRNYEINKFRFYFFKVTLLRYN